MRTLSYLGNVGHSSGLIRISDRPFESDKLIRDQNAVLRGSATTKQLGRYGERLVQKWLFLRSGIRTNPATIRSPTFGTVVVDLFDRTASWVYEVKMGRVILDRTHGRGSILEEMSRAKVIRGGTFVSVEHESKVGFSDTAIQNLTGRCFKLLKLRRVQVESLASDVPAVL